MTELKIIDLAAALKREEQKPQEPCRGLIFRLRRSSWSHTGDSVGFKYQFRLLKRKWCKGCDQCLFLWDDLNERIDDWGKDLSWSDIEFGNTDQAMYQLKVTNISRDWESGYVDDWDIGFVEYKEEKECDQKKK